jgi:hypothetical protein
LVDEIDRRDRTGAAQRARSAADRLFKRLKASRLDHLALTGCGAPCVTPSNSDAG